MAFFKGQETYSIDAKGRVNIPAKMRRSISPEAQETFTLTRGQEKCIFAYPLDEWKKYEEKFERLNQFDEENRFFLRRLLMWSEEVTLDAQQRIMAPRKLLEFAEIENKVLIVGMVDHIELWNPDNFEKYLNGFEASYESVAAKVMNL
ncbi:MAG: division/cell wall cluster transcriptional repressor MraZ [Chloroflexota bacterium]